MVAATVEQCEQTRDDARTGSGADTSRFAASRIDHSDEPHLRHLRSCFSARQTMGSSLESCKGKARSRFNRILSRAPDSTPPTPT